MQGLKTWAEVVLNQRNMGPGVAVLWEEGKTPWVQHRKPNRRVLSTPTSQGDSKETELNSGDEAYLVWG